MSGSDTYNKLVEERNELAGALKDTPMSRTIREMMQYRIKEIRKEISDEIKRTNNRD